MIRLRDITLPFDHTPEALAGGIAERLGISAGQLLGFTIAHKAIDARRKNHIVAVYAIDAQVENEPAVLSRLSHDSRITAGHCTAYQMPAVGAIHGRRPVIVGSGQVDLGDAAIVGQNWLKGRGLN